MKRKETVCIRKKQYTKVTVHRAAFRETCKIGLGVNSYGFYKERGRDYHKAGRF